MAISGPATLRRLMVWSLISPVVLILAVPIAARETQSATLAKELGRLLSEQQLDAIAAADASGTDRFTAAMLIPGVQLLVVSARYPAPDYLRWLIAQKNYHQAYLSLQQAALPDGKLFFQDLGCDGLQLGQAETVDVMYEHGTTQTLFDGQWKKRHESEDAYLAKLKEADTQYSRLLTLLVDAVRPTPTAPAGRGTPR